VVRKIRRQDMVALAQRRTQLLEHVGRLSAAVETQHRRRARRSPFEIVHLTAVDDGKAAPPTRGDVVAWNLNRCRAHHSEPCRSRRMQKACGDRKAPALGVSYQVLGGIGDAESLPPASRCVLIRRRKGAGSMPHVRVGDIELYYELIDCTEPWRAGPAPVVF